MPNRTGSERVMTYASPAIRARRQRILEVTRRIIAEEGIDALSMNEVGRRADVAKRTLYNAFTTREAMIAAAVQEYFEDYTARIPFRSPRGTLMYNLERLISFNQHNLKIRNYIRAVMSCYHNGDADSDLSSTMDRMSMRHHRDWLEPLKRKGQLQPWVDIEALVADIKRFEFATLSDWAAGRLGDDALIPRSIIGYLTIVAGATRGTTRREVEECLRSISRDGIPSLPLPNDRVAA